MSSLKSLLGRLVASLLSPGRASSEPESMSLHDWADLPAHHPASDPAPC